MSSDERILRILMRFGLDEQSAQLISNKLDDQENDVADIARQWELLRKQVGLTEAETVTAIQGSITGQKLEADQILAVGHAYEAKQDAESAAAQKVTADLDAEKDRLAGIEANTKLIAQSFTNMIGAGRFLSEIGRAGSVFGTIFNNDDLKRLGQLTTGIGDLVMALGRLPQALKAIQGVGGLSSILAGAGGVLLGAGIYDATIGRAQGTDAGTIVKQTLASAAYSLGALTGGAEAGAAAFKNAAQNLGLMESEADKSAASIKAWAEQVKQATADVYDPQAGLGLTLEMLKKLRETGVSDMSMAGLERALDENKKLLQLRLTEGDVVGSTAAQVSTSIDLITAAIDQLKKKNEEAERTTGVIEKEAVKPTEASDRVNSVLKETTRLQGELVDYSKTYHAAQLAQTKEIAKLNTDINQKRIDDLGSLNSDLAKLETNYYASRTKAAESFGTEMLRMEQDHQVDMKRLQEDHGRRLRQLSDQRDALGIEDENANYELERRRSEEDYNKQVARRNEDFALQLRDMEDAFRQQRQARIDQYSQQLNDLNDYLTAQNKVITDQFQAVFEAIARLMKPITDQVGGKTYAGAGVVNSGEKAGSKQAGGYQDYTGLTYMHAGEFVLNSATTSAMERAAGGRLTQGGVLGMMGGGMAISITQSFGGQESSPAVYKQIIYQTITDVFDKAMRQ